MSRAENSAIGVRVGVKSGGCAGMSYVMEYAKEIKPNEEIIEDKGVKVLIDPTAVIYLLGTEMDYKEEKFSFFDVLKSPPDPFTQRTSTCSPVNGSVPESVAEVFPPPVLVIR